MDSKKFNIDYAWVDSFWNKIENKLSVVAPQVNMPFPYGIENGKYVSRDMYQWTNGFWPGMMWLMYIATKDEKYKNIAEKVEIALDEALDDFDGLHHDVGFMWLCSAVANYRVTGNEKSKNRGRHAATILAGRFNPVGNYIRAWNKWPEDDIDNHSGWAIIDCMMNIQLLYWASKVDNDPRFKFIADAHAHTAMKNFVRENGSTNHVVIFNPETGEFLDNPTGQGYASGSCWSRGNSWALYGFILCYLNTGNKEYLDTAKKVADYFIANVGDADLPKCDFDQPAEPDIRDSAASAIATCGLIEIAKSVPDSESDKYINAAMHLLKGLEKSCDFDPDNQSIVQNGTGMYHNTDRNIPIIYSDYYLMEALLKLKGNDILFW